MQLTRLIRKFLILQVARVGVCVCYGFTVVYIHHFRTNPCGYIAETCCGSIRCSLLGQIIEGSPPLNSQCENHGHVLTKPSKPEPLTLDITRSILQLGSAQVGGWEDASRRHGVGNGIFKEFSRENRGVTDPKKETTGSC